MPNQEKQDRWKNEAMRLGGEALVEKIFELADGQKVMLEKMDAFEDRHRDAEVAIQKLYTGFPDGDVAGHCRFHDVMIATLEERRKLRVAIQEKTISGLIWSLIVGAFFLIWHGFLRFIK